MICFKMKKLCCKFDIAAFGHHFREQEADSKKTVLPTSWQRYLKRFFCS